MNTQSATSTISSESSVQRRSGTVTDRVSTVPRHHAGTRARADTVVALYIDELRGYGADRVVLKVANGLAQSGLSVDLVLARRRNSTGLSIDPAIRVIELGSSRNNLWRNISGLATYLRAHQPTILFSTIHFNNIVTASAIWLAKTETRLVLRQANILRRQLKDYPFPIGPLLKISVRMAYRRADIVVCQCHSMLTDIVGFMRVPREKVQVLYNPTITPDIFVQATETVDHSWLTDKQFPVLLAIGRLKPQKDFATLIRGFAELKRSQPGVRLIILGQGPQRDALEQLSITLGVAEDVDFPGFRSNPYAFMAAADVIISSSQYEGLPNVLIEALALGKKIVATNCMGGTAEILKYGEFGQLVPVGDPFLLAQAIARSLDQPSASLYSPVASEDFQQDQQIQKYIAVLESQFAAREPV